MSLRTRSDEQNRFYHKCVVEPYLSWLLSTGDHYTHIGAHRELAKKFLGVTATRPDGTLEHYVMSTRTLSVGQMSEYIERCQSFLTELGVKLPDGEEMP